MALVSGSTTPHLTQLFAAASRLTAPGIAWSPADFTAVDDRVRGGTSISKVHLTSDDGDGGEEQAGELLFSGFLDTITLGGAGFASQQHSTNPPFPIHLSQHKHQGLQLRVRPLKLKEASASLSLTRSAEDQIPGGGKAPVTTYVLNLYPNLPVKKPDGRNESTVLYEYTFSLDDAADTSHDGRQSCPLLTFDFSWSDFKPTYRGRPAKEAGPLNPSEVKLWSIMARSNFGDQSGPFRLQVHSLWAIEKERANSLQHREIEDSRPPTKEKGEVMWRREEPGWQPADMSGSAGFALYLFATLALVIWTLWALVPDRFLRAVGIDWYPNREWAFILPSFTLILFPFAYIVYLALNIRMTPDLNDLRAFTDTHTNTLPLQRAEDLSFSEAREYYQHEHPMRQQNITPEQRKSVLSRDMYDLPLYDDKDRVSDEFGSAT